MKSGFVEAKTCGMGLVVEVRIGAMRNASTWSTHLRYEDARDPLSNAEKRLLGILLGRADRRFQIAGVREDRRAMLGLGVQLRLLEVRLVGHCWMRGVVITTNPEGK